MTALFRVFARYTSLAGCPAETTVERAADTPKAAEASARAALAAQAREGSIVIKKIKRAKDATP